MSAAAAAVAFCSRRLSGADNLLSTIRSFSSQIQSLEIDPFLTTTSTRKPHAFYFTEISSDLNLSSTKRYDIPLFAGPHHCIGSSEGYLILLNATKKLFAADPFTRGQVLIPSTATLPELCRSHQSNFYSLYQGKAILSPNTTTIVVIPDGFPIFAHTGSDSFSWTPLRNPRGFWDDCIFHKGYLHCINHAGTLAVHDLDHPLSPLFVSREGPLAGCGDTDHRRFLVESPDKKDLFLVFRGSRLDRHGCPSDQGCFHYGFKVFKLNKNGDSYYEWNQVESLGDFSLFVGTNRSLAVRACDFSNVKANCIYFTDFRTTKFFDDFEEDDFHTSAGFFNLEDESIQFYKLNGIQKPNSPPIWYFPPG